MSGRLDRFSSMSVLVVDDHPANVALLASLLEEEGLHRITTQTDSRRVAGVLPHCDPDLVLLDLHMPHVDGHTVLRQIAQFASGTYLPVLVMTADSTSTARDRALAQGARDFLIKPFDTTEAVLRIANLLETRQLYSSLRRTALAQAQQEAAAHAPPATRSRIEKVLATEQFTSAFQPVVELDSHATVGHEALSRFREPHARGPAGWFSDAFDVGLGVELEWLAAQQAVGFFERAGSGFLAINMSPATVLHLAEHELCPAALYPRLVIELTEHVPIEDYSAVHRALRELREHGARLAADDIGSGYAGFRHLVALQPDIIKLDISLVSGIQRSRAQRALAGALVAFAGDIDAVVIAEGVETPDELSAVRELGVPLAQGYYLGRPAHPATS